MIKAYRAYFRDNPNRYWFKRKIYGWGWTPARWQGWVATGVFVIAFIYSIRRRGMPMVLTPRQELEMAVELLAITALFLLVCYKTGEKPRWQWGLPPKDNEPHA